MKELRHGIYQLKAINNKKEYANLNTNNGTLVYYRNLANFPMSNSKMTVKQLDEEINKGNAKWILKEYQQFMKEHGDIYNTMIDKINKSEIMI